MLNKIHLVTGHGWLMSLRFSVLASGSRGNAALLVWDGQLLLIDAGLGPRVLESRLRCHGYGWEAVSAVLLTHTHGDHAREETLRFLAGRGIRLVCHDGHIGELEHREGFQRLWVRGLVRPFREETFLMAPGLWVEPIELRHSGPTFGFRLEGKARGARRPHRLGYISDTGTWTEAMAEVLADVGLLALEFNHDVEMTRSSDRSWFLNARNLGDRGHLSNRQAGALVEAVLRKSDAAHLRKLVLLHLSEDCNRPEIAVKAAREAIRPWKRRVQVILAGGPNPTELTGVSCARPEGRSSRPSRRPATLGISSTSMLF